jgi:hypothetical protein
VTATASIGGPGRSHDLAEARRILFQPGRAAIPTPFLAVLVLWLGILFAGFGLVSANHRTAIATLFVCALSVSGALFLIEGHCPPARRLDADWLDADLVRASADRALPSRPIVQRSPAAVSSFDEIRRAAFPSRTKRIEIFRFGVLFFQTLCPRSLVKRGEIRATLF